MSEDGARAMQPEAAAQDVFPLDDALIRLLEEHRMQIEVIGAQQRGALLLFIRQHNLKGNWSVAPNGRELIRGGE
jgi:uncharacterized protein (DUF362 family)